MSHAGRRMSLMNLQSIPLESCIVKATNHIHSSIIFLNVKVDLSDILRVRG